MLKPELQEGFVPLVTRYKSIRERWVFRVCVAELYSRQRVASMSRVLDGKNGGSSATPDFRRMETESQVRYS